jgi:hypothetical protein
MPYRSISGSVAGVSRFLRTGGCALVLCAGAVGATGQEVAKSQEAGPAVRLVSAQQGRKIAEAAVAEDEPVRGAQDCSHLVQQIYSEAGYEYPYASSYELYAGHGNFRRVRHAQAGDLVTWPGHVGIVLDPKQHSFYSLVRTGLQAEDYLSPYWRSRGRPRFYRYVVASGPQVQTAQAERSAAPSGKTVSHRGVGGTVEQRAEAYAVSEKHADGERIDAEEARAKRTTEDASQRSVVPAPPTNAEAAGPSMAESEPARILITAEQRRPTAAETLDGISELSKAAANTLRASETFNGKMPTVIFDEVRVEKIETKRDSGWAHLQIDSRVQLTSDGADYKRRREKVKWELRREASGWVAIAPAQRSYVGRDAAVRVLAAQLAEMTQSEGAARHDQSVVGQEARIANLLSALLEQ